jgi:hypothetical protein
MPGWSFRRFLRFLSFVLRSITWYIFLVVVFVLFIATSLAVLAGSIGYFHCIDSDATATVSSYYGPGAFWAWLITAISTVVKYELSARPSHDPSHDADTQTNPLLPQTEVQGEGGPNSIELDLDGQAFSAKAGRKDIYEPGFIATVAYPIIAAADALYQSFSERNRTQIRAAMAVIQSAQLLAYLAITVLMFKRPKRTYELGQLPIEGMPSTNRVRIWIILLVTSSYDWALVLFPVLPKQDGSHLLFFDQRAFFAIFSFVVVLGGCTLLRSNSLRRLHWEAGFYFVATALSTFLIFRQGFLTPEEGEDCIHSFELGVPQSGSRLRDLDQATALGTALVIAAIPIYQKAIRRFRNWRNGDGSTVSRVREQFKGFSALALVIWAEIRVTYS